jgi:hypothetical protein
MSALAAGARGLLVGSCLGLCGCFTDALVFQTSTRLGVEIVTTEEQPGVKFGYTRFEGATMPLRRDGEAQSREVLPEAFPIVAAFGHDTGGFLPVGGERQRGMRTLQIFATGDAATDAAGPVVRSFAAASPALVGIPPEEERRLARELLLLLDALPEAQRPAAYDAVGAELGRDVRTMNGARDAVQDAGSSPDNAAALRRALERVRPLAAQEGR